MSKSNKKKSYEVNDHQLYFTPYSVLINLFRNNKVSPSKYWMLFKILLFASITQIFIVLQNLIFASRLKKVDVKSNPPVFILGHWRSGTTHLHYLMAKDPNLGFASNYHGFLINISLLGRGWLDKMLSVFVPEKRPMDNVQFGMFTASEEEQSVGNRSDCSGVHSLFFPKNRTYFDRYITFNNSSAADKERWQKAYDEVLRIIAYSNDNKRMLIKNPFNTARPTELDELYPGAKFVFIHRNPYEIYRSTMILHQKVTKSQFLQEMSEQDIIDLTFRNYNEVMRAYIEKKKSIPAENLIEIGFDELSLEPIKTMKKVYKHLNLPDWEKAAIEMQNYLNTVENYEKNSFKPLAPEIVERIQKEWAITFEEWGYDPTIIN